METSLRSNLNSNTVIQWSLQNFVHGTTAVLSWHVQKPVAIWWPVTELQQGEASTELELWAKNLQWNGPQITKKPCIKIHASQPGFRNRTSDRLVVVPPANQMPGPKTPTNQQGPQHGNQSLSNPGRRSMDQSMRKEHSIADTLEPYLSHTNPWKLQTIW